LVVWVVVVDDCCGTGPPKELLESKAQLKKIFDCNDQGDMKEYIGCKVEYNKDERYMKILQPVLVQSFKDEFDLKLDEPIATPAVPGSTLSKGEPDTTPFQQFKYRSGVGKLIHLAKWSRPEILNAVRDLARHMSAPSTKHLQALDRCMAHVVQTPNRGLVLKPEGSWDGKGEHEFVILGRSDTNYAACPDTRRSIGGHNVFLHQAPTESKCNMQNWVTLSSTEAETAGATTCAQSMLFHYRLLRSVGLKVRLPMVLEVDNKGTKDLVNNWSAGGRLRHVEVRQFFLRDLKEDGLIVVKWIPTDVNSSDIFTKNLYGPLFEKHAKVMVGQDEYMQYGGDKVNQDEDGGGEWTTVMAKKKRQSVLKNKKPKPPNLMPTGCKVRFNVEKSRGEGVGGRPWSDGRPTSVRQPLSVDGWPYKKAQGNGIQMNQV
jgi:hypothetical protein